MKQTAVEWLISEISNSVNMPFRHFDELKEQAKEMEKQQTIDFAESYVFECVTCSYEGESISLKDAEEYYNEKFNK